jgi:DegV family protein with EDD domain
MARRVRVLTDSVADLPRAYRERYQIKVLPIYLMINGQTYLDDGSLDRDWFYRQLARVSQKPTTAAPAPQEFLAAYETLRDEGAEEIIALLTASSVSSLCDHARLAAQEVTGVRVHVIDTGQITMGLGWMVVAAARMLAEGVSVPEILETVRGMRARTRVLGVLDSIDYLRRSGRVGWVAGQMAGLLKIKPVIAFDQGEALMLQRVRTQWRAVQAMLERVRGAQPFESLAVLHSRVTEATLRRFQDELAGITGGLASVPVVDIGTIFATHVGPGCLGVALVSAV